jgi:hypothetical protein
MSGQEDNTKAAEAAGTGKLYESRMPPRPSAGVWGLSSPPSLRSSPPRAIHVTLLRRHRSLHLVHLEDR